MTTADPKAADLYRRFRELPESARQQFLALIKATETVKETHGTAPTRAVALLYARIEAKFYSYQGIRLLPLQALRKTEVERELEAALEWLKAGKDVNRDTLNGLIEMAAEAVARQVPYFADARKRGMHFEAHRKLLSNIPAVFDAAFPGYKHNDILHQIAENVGKGALPLQEVLEE